MLKITYHQLEIQLSLFGSPENRDCMTTTARLKGYRVGPRLDVHPIWCEVRK
jgi:hypothetical protein